MPVRNESMADEAVAALRAELAKLADGIGQANLGRILGISQPEVSRLLSGKRALSVAHMKAISLAFPDLRPHLTALIVPRRERRQRGDSYGASAASTASEEVVAG